MNFDIAKKIEYIAGTLPAGVKLIAVSKKKPAGDIETAYRWGQRAFGENWVQELTEKHLVLPQDIEWHMIGHLQTNKVKYIAPFVTLIHAVDSMKLLSEINKEAFKHQRTIDCLLQFHIAEEETKFGFSGQEAAELLESEAYRQLQNVRITGVMGMATNTGNDKQVRKEFGHLKEIFEHLKQQYFEGYPSFRELSMGMSGDYLIAVEEGSTMVRIGSSIFGDRVY